MTRRFGQARFRAWWNPPDRANGTPGHWYVWDRWGQFHNRTAPTLKAVLTMPVVKRYQWDKMREDDKV